MYHICKSSCRPGLERGPRSTRANTETITVWLPDAATRPILPPRLAACIEARGNDLLQLDSISGHIGASKLTSHSQHAGPTLPASSAAKAPQPATKPHCASSTSSISHHHQSRLMPRRTSHMAHSNGSSPRACNPSGRNPWARISASSIWTTVLSITMARSSAASL